MPIPSGLCPQAGQWNPNRNTKGREALTAPEINDPTDRQEWNSDDEAFDEFGRKKKKRKTGAAPAPARSRTEKAFEAAKAKVEAKVAAKAAGAETASASSQSEKPTSIQAVYDFVKKQTSADAGVGPSPASLLSDQSASLTALSLLRQAASSSAVPDLVQKSALASVLDLKRSGAAGAAAAASLQSVQRTLQPPGRKSTQEAAMEVAERSANQRNLQHQMNRGANTGANSYHMRKQMKPVMPCKYFQEGTCKNGFNCQFSHDRMEYCKFFINGMCMKGEGCNAIHPQLDEVDGAPKAAFTDFESGDPTSGLSYAGPQKTGQTLMERLWQSSNEEKKQGAGVTPAAPAPKPTLMEELYSRAKSRYDEKYGDSGYGYDSMHGGGDSWGSGYGGSDGWGSGYSGGDGYGSGYGGDGYGKSGYSGAAGYDYAAATLLSSSSKPAEKSDRQTTSSSSKEVVKEPPKEPAKPPEPTREEVVQRMRAATVKALQDRDAAAFLRELDALKKYIPEEEYTTTKKTIQMALAPKAMAASRNEDLQNLGRIRRA